MPLLIMSHSCDDDTASVSQINEEYMEIPVTEEVCATFIEDRRTVDTYKGEPGEIRVLQHSDGPQLVIAPERISPYMSTEVIQVCNIPVPDTLQYFNDGDKIIFSGILKEIYPTENMPGNHFVLTSIRIRMDNLTTD